MAQTETGGRIAVRLQQHADPPFQKRAPLALGRPMQLLPRGPDDARIGPVEFRMFALLDAQPRLVGGQQPRQVRVRQDLQVAGDRRPRDPRVSRQAGDVEHLSVEEGRHGEKPGEARQVADQRLGLDLLLQIELDVCLQAVALSREPAR